MDEMRHTIGSVRFRVLAGIGIALVLAMSASALADRGDEQGGATLTVGVDEAKKVETAKKIPITSKRGAKPVVVASLSPKELGGVEPGNEVEGFAEVEVSVTCLESDPSCVGSRYSFSPHVDYWMVLASGQNDSKGYRVGKVRNLTCSQELPNRNHHCRLVLDESQVVKSSKKLRCAQNCRLNVVASAYHEKAQGGQVLVVGADSHDGIEQGKAALSAAVFSKPSGSFDFRKAGKAKRIRKSLPIQSQDQSSDEEVIYSTRIDGLKKGESLLVDARATVSLKGVHYNVLLQPELIVAEKPTKPEFTGVAVQVMTNNGKIANQNGSNCTRGSSYFSDPCKIRKVGAAHLLYNAVKKPRNDKGAPVPLYVNLVLAASQQYGGSYHSSDKVKIVNGSIDIRRYPADYSP